MEKVTKVVRISEINRDIQQRAFQTDIKLVERYAEAMKEGDKFPNPVLFFDGETYWLADGYHRVQAYLSTQDPNFYEKHEMEFDIIGGSRNEAILYNIQVNANHGLGMSTAEKKKAVWTVLNMNPELSDRQIAKICGTDHKTVGKYRKMKEEGKDPFAPKEATEGSEGTGEAKESEPRVSPKERVKELEKDLEVANATIESLKRDLERARKEAENPKKGVSKKMIMKLLHPDIYEKALKAKHEDLYAKIEEAFKILTA